VNRDQPGRKIGAKGYLPFIRRIAPFRVLTEPAFQVGASFAFRIAIKRQYDESAI
jgi:hypothetical protein